jgi:hypothetical protein
VLIEGTVDDRCGADCTALVREWRHEADLRWLNDPALWGTAITDERYLLLNRR